MAAFCDTYLSAVETIGKHAAARISGMTAAVVEVNAGADIDALAGGCAV